MHLDLKITVPADILPSERELAQAAGRGVSNIVKRRLVERDRRGRSDGLPRTGYYGDGSPRNDGMYFNRGKGNFGYGNGK